MVAAVAGIAGPNAWVAREARGRVFADVASVPARSVAIVPGARVVRGKQAHTWKRDWTRRWPCIGRAGQGDPGIGQ